MRETQCQLVYACFNDLFELIISYDVVPHVISQLCVCTSLFRDLHNAYYKMHTHTYTYTLALFHSPAADMILYMCCAEVV